MPGSSLLVALKPSLGDLAIVVSLQALIIGAVYAAGFSALSDDDYARVVIAEAFVQNPSWDPSGTSWLPLPFLITGSAMSVFGSSLFTARVVGWCCSLASACLLYTAARILGLGRAPALWGTLLGALVPTAALLAAAPIPEYYSAALTVLGVCTLANRDHRLLGACCLFAACASRYESWPVALAFALMCFAQAASSRLSESRKAAQESLAPLWAAGSLALLFPVIWIAHGYLSHDDAFFFVTRVRDYQQALSSAQGPSTFELLWLFPKTLLLAEPGISLMSLYGCTAAAIVSSMAPSRSAAQYGQRQGVAMVFSPWLPLLVGFFVLCISAARGGAPTHHPERALLSVWLLAALFLARALAFGFSQRRHNWALPAATCCGGLLALSLNLAGLWQRDGFAQRASEEKLGRWLKEHIPATTSVALLLDDYGYFAVMAASGRPRRFAALQNHDPRAAVAQDAPLSAWLSAPDRCVYVSPRNNPTPRPRVLHVEGELMVSRAMLCDRPQKPAPDQPDATAASADNSRTDRAPPQSE